MTSKVCVEKLPHSCGSSRGLQVFQLEDAVAARLAAEKELGYLQREVR